MRTKPIEEGTTEREKKETAAAETEIFDGVMSVYTIFHKMVFRSLNGTGLTAGQPKILDFLAYGGTMIQKDIAGACEIEPSTAARILTKMEASDLIRREKQQSNRRAISVSLTEHGAVQAALVQKAFGNCEKTAFSGFEKGDCGQFMDILDHIEINLRCRTGMIRSQVPESFGTSFHERLRSCQSLMYKQLFYFLKDAGLTSGQPKILEFLEKGEGCQQKDIAAACGIEPATVTSLLLYMERDGLIERRGEKQDRRSLHVYLTEKGQEKRDQTLAALAQTVAAAFSGIEEEQETFKKSLLLIRRNLEEKEKVHD